MRFLLPALLLATILGGPLHAAGEGVVRDEASNFEIALPPEKVGDWDVLPHAPERKDIKAHFRTEFRDTEPLATAEVQLIVYPLNKDLAACKLETIAGRWAGAMEGSLANPRDRTEQPTTLGGQPAFVCDVKGDLVKGSGVGHVTWTITKMGRSAYVIHVVRTYKAVGDESLEGEIRQIRDSFKFLKVEEVKADPKAKGGDGPAGPAGAGAAEQAKGPDPELLKREEKKIDWWRVKFVKPEGLLDIPPEKFDEYETKNHCISKFDRTAEQNRILIRVYAQLEKNQAYTIEQLAENYLKYFKQTYNEKSRLPEEIEKDYKKFPQAKSAIRMKLTGRRTVPEIQFYYLAQCKNGRQYQIEIHLWGAESEKYFKTQIDDFLKSFKPQEE